MYLDLTNQYVNSDTVVEGKKLNEIYRYENMTEKTGMCIMRGSQGFDGSKYNVEILASLPDGQSVVNITERKLYGK